MKRIGMLIFSIAFIALMITSCEEKSVVALGQDWEIYVIAEEDVWSETEQYIRPALEKKLVTPMVEKEFVSAAEAFQREGEQRGRIQEKQQVLARHIERKFGLLSGERLRIEGETDPEKLDAALDAVLFAASKGEVLSRLVRPGAAAS